MAAAMALPAVTPAPAIWRQQQRRRFKRQPPPAAEAHGTRGFPAPAPPLKGRMDAGELGLQLPVCIVSAGGLEPGSSVSLHSCVALRYGKELSHSDLLTQNQKENLLNGQSAEEARLGTSVSSHLKTSPVACSYRVPGNTDHSLCQLKTQSTLLEAWDHG
ncbi:uncharacterized protein LOC111925746 isoform X2 [Cyanistes caeruleus]|uniref:uncharacterized protein LOC111925746 isoform X2 n=1 Tax=Cyanistes caeruleus TaxID=156563 RepID=UPI000CDAE9D9|nr:uncharacterized protein LOC111925746 isoform X2 [Cyanistes caeruleus]